jgi:hypothetical protein
MNNKTTICLEKSTLIKSLLGDIAKTENKSISGIIEQIILETLLPADKNMRWIAENYLYSPDWSISKTLTIIFENNSAGINFQAVHDNMIELVQFANKQEIFKTTMLTGKEAELHHMASQLQSILNYLSKSGGYDETVTWGNEILEELQTEPRITRLTNIYQLIINSWDVLKNRTETYRLLSDITSVSSYINNIDMRKELLHLMIKISNEWTI